METKEKIVSIVQNLSSAIFDSLTKDKAGEKQVWHNVCRFLHTLRELPDGMIATSFKMGLADARKDFAKANPDLTGTEVNGFTTIRYLRSVLTAINRTDSAAPEAIADRLPLMIGSKGGTPIFETRGQYRDRMAKPSSGRGTQNNSNGSNGGNAPAPVAEAMVKALSASDGASEPLQRRAAEILARAAAEGWSLAAWQSVVAALEAATKVHAVKQVAPAAKPAAKKKAA
jgi:hypothetical protein